MRGGSSQKSIAEQSKGDFNKELIEEENGLFIQRNRFIQQYYHVLAFFLEYTDKWFITKKEKFLLSQED